MKQNADLDRRNKALIVIENPSKPDPQPKLLNAVMQVVPEHSKVNHLLRYGSRGRPKNPKERFRSRYSLPDEGDICADECTFQTKVTVHRSLS